MSSTSSFKVIEAIELSDFYGADNKEIFAVMQQQYSKGSEIDRITIESTIGRKIDEVFEAAASVTNTDAYIERLKELSKKRMLMNTAIYIQEEISGDTAENILTKAESLLYRASKGSQEKKIYTPAELLPIILEKKDKKEIFVGSSIPEFDEICGGFDPGNLVIIAGRPSMGKTEYAIQVLVHNALKGYAGVIYSIEQSAQELMERIIANVTEIYLTKIRNRELNRTDAQKISDLHDTISALPIFIDDSPGVTMLQVASKTRRLKMQHPNLRLGVVDYLQLMDMPGRNRVEEIGAITRTFKILSRDLDMSMTVLSQLSRECDKRENKRPLLSDLRESGNIEQDADKVIFMYSDFPYTKSPEDEFSGEIILAKHRNGRVGSIKIYNNKLIQKITAAKIGVANDTQEDFF